MKIDHSVASRRTTEFVKGYRVEFRRAEAHGHNYPVQRRWQLFSPTIRCKATWEDGLGGSFMYETEARNYASERSKSKAHFEYRIVRLDDLVVLRTYRKGKVIVPLADPKAEGGEPDIHPFFTTLNYNQEGQPYLMANLDLHVEDYGTLTFNKDDLVARLKERLEANEAERQAKKDKAAARNKEAHDRIVAALDNPQFLVWLAGNLKKWNLEFDAASDAFATRVAETWPDTNGADTPEASDPDRGLRTMIDVYELASDTEVKIAVTDEAYRYLGKPKETAETPAE